MLDTTTRKQYCFWAWEVRTLNFLYDGTWWRLVQTHVMCTKLIIYGFFILNMGKDNDMSLRSPTWKLSKCSTSEMCRSKTKFDQLVKQNRTNWGLIYYYWLYSYNNTIKHVVFFNLNIFTNEWGKWIMISSKTE